MLQNAIDLWLPTQIGRSPRPVSLLFLCHAQSLSPCRPVCARMTRAASRRGLLLAQGRTSKGATRVEVADSLGRLKWRKRWESGVGMQCYGGKLTCLKGRSAFNRVGLRGTAC